LFFTYSIVPRGRGEADALAKGNLYAPNLDATKRYVQTINPPNVEGRKDLEVIPTDSQRRIIWAALTTYDNASSAEGQGWHRHGNATVLLRARTKKRPAAPSPPGILSRQGGPKLTGW
jgi:hypothetical protein